MKPNLKLIETLEVYEEEEQKEFTMQDALWILGFVLGMCAIYYGLFYLIVNTREFIL